MGKWLIVLPMLYATALAAEPAWTWIDANGRRHYSDRPVEGATRIDLPGAQGFATQSETPTPAARPAGAASTSTSTSAQAVAYRSLTITSPAQEETLWNIGGVLNVSLGIDPGLQPGHRIDAYLDGQRVVQAAITSQFTIPDVVRGLHTMYAVIRDSSGREARRSPEVTFMVQQTSVQSPPPGPRTTPRPVPNPR